MANTLEEFYKTTWHGSSIDRERHLANSSGAIIATITKIGSHWTYEGTRYISEEAARAAAERANGGLSYD